VIAVFTADQASRLTGVSRRQLGSWDRNGFFKPSIVYGERGAYARLYSFRDLLSLKVLNQLRNKTRVSLDHLREVKRDLSHLGEYMRGSSIGWQRPRESR
jgi:Predicted transcriptional regulators